MVIDLPLIFPQLVLYEIVCVYNVHVRAEQLEPTGVRHCFVVLAGHRMLFSGLWHAKSPLHVSCDGGSSNTITHKKVQISCFSIVLVW